MKGMPILLTEQNSIPDEIQNYLNANKAAITGTYIVGGTGVISNTVSQKLNNAVRLAGTNRYETNAVITSKFSSILNSGNVYIATGKDFPDALACSALAPITDSPIILADSVSEDAAEAYLSNNIDGAGTITAVGGTGAVPDTVLNNAVNNYGKKVNNPVIASPFKDAKLEKAVRDTLNKPTGDFHKSDFNRIIVLNANSYGVSDISGIENLTNMKTVLFGKSYDSGYNNITAISQLKDLKKLKTIDLSYNKINDISPLSELTNLTELNLSSNLISNIDAVKGLTN